MDKKNLVKKERDEYYTGDYQVKTRFKNGKHAKFVLLLENPKTGHLLIKKRYKKVHYDIFLNEVIYLEKLKECKFIPNLYKVRPSSLTIYMSYCGKPIDRGELKKKEYQDKIKKYKQILKNKYGVYHNDLKQGNVCQLEDQMYFIDLGWMSKKKLKPGYGAGRAGGL